MLDSSRTEIVLGPPGTGKTTALLNRIDALLDAGVRPDRIGYLAFSKVASDEAIGRACERFGKNPKDFPNFRTLHSLCFRQLGLKKEQVLSSKHYREIGRATGIWISGREDHGDDNAAAYQKGDRIVLLDQVARARCVPLRNEWANDNCDLSWDEVAFLQKAILTYKDSRGLFDFTDMLVYFLEHGHAPTLDVLFVDEAQDLSQLQWRCIAKIAQRASHTVIAGDDDQAIHRWAGADLDTFLTLRGKEHVLGQSWRCPIAVQDLAAGILQRIGERREKSWSPRPLDGVVEWAPRFEHLNFTQGSWLVLARNAATLKEISEHLVSQGIWHRSRGGRTPVDEETLHAVFDWEGLRRGEAIRARRLEKLYHWLGKGTAVDGGWTPWLSNLKQTERFTAAELRDRIGARFDMPWFEALTTIPEPIREYLRACLRRNQNLQATPRVQLNTIHGAKGAEADNVVLFTDMSRRTYEGMQRNPDDEHRCFYVGVTRSRERLFVIQPTTSTAYSL